MIAPTRALVLTALLAVACDDAEDSATADDTGPSQDDTGTPSDMPPDPTPFTLTVSGALSADLVFDAPTCYQPEGSSNFRAFWRNASQAHVFVLIAEVLGDFTGPGSYDAASVRASAKLQEEAGGEGRYFAVDTASGDTLVIEVEAIDEEKAWGEFTFSGMRGSEGAVQVSPMPVPIWCPTLN